MTSGAGSEAGSGVKAAALGRLLGADEVELEPLTSGTSRQTAAVRVRRGVTVERLILQAHATGDGRLRLFPRAEADLLGRAGAAGVPVPVVVAASDDPAVIGAPFVLTRHLPGESIPARLHRDPALGAARDGLARQLGATIARLQEVNVDDLPLLERIDDPLVHLRGEADDLALVRPVMELAFAWLAEHRPPPGPPVLVHGDLRLGNLLVDHTGLVAVLDWELAHVGQAGEDLGWLCVPSWRFGHRPPVGGMGTIEELLAGYAAARPGPVPDAADLRWWTVLGTLRWGVICGRQVQAFLAGEVGSHELAAVGRRMTEAEADLLALLAPAPLPQLPPAGRGDGLDRPGVDALFGAVDAWADRVADEATGAARYDARVARTLIGILRREAALGPTLAAERVRLLGRLGAGSEEDLAGAVRDGRWAPLDPALLDVLRRITAGRMAINDPSYRGAWNPP